jgi:hypothetical protein
MSRVATVIPIDLGLKIVLNRHGEKMPETGKRNAFDFYKRSTRGGRRKKLGSVALLIVLVASVFYVPLVVRYDLQLVSLKDDHLYRDAAGIIKFYADDKDYIITDDQALAFFAERDVPPELVDIAFMRISSDYLSFETVIEISNKYKVEVVALWTGRLERLTAFVDYVKLNFELVSDFGGGRQIYLRNLLGRSKAHCVLSQVCNPKMGNWSDPFPSFVVCSERQLTSSWPSILLCHSLNESIDPYINPV